MPPFLGIDHPLVVVRDLDAVADRYVGLGFAPCPPGRHPWGTSMRVVQFDGCSIELMSLYDEALIDVHGFDGFAFGRYIRDQLQEREGISLLALHSEDAEGDAATVAARGIACTGTIEFGRDVRMADGRIDRTRTTLKILRDPELPRLSNFAVHQHRPDLIFRPDWLVHPNGASGIHRVAVMAEPTRWSAVRKRLAGLYGEEALFRHSDGFGARTGNGDFVVMDRVAVERTYGPLPPALAAEDRPSCVAIHVTVPDAAKVRPFLDAAAARYVAREAGFSLLDADAYGNVFLVLETHPGGH